MEIIRHNYQLILTLTCIGWLLYNSGRSQAQDDNVFEELTVRSLRVVDDDGNLICNIGKGSHGASMNLMWPESNSNVSLSVSSYGSLIQMGKANQSYLNLSTREGEYATATFLTNSGSLNLGSTNEASYLSMRSGVNSAALTTSLENECSLDEEQRKIGSAGLYISSDLSRIAVQGRDKVLCSFDCIDQIQIDSKLSLSLSRDGYSAQMMDSLSESRFELTGSTLDWIRMGAIAVDSR